MKLLLSPTPVALWHDIIHDAEASCATPLQEELESYLVFLLIRYTNKPEIVKQIVATQVLQSLHFGPTKRQIALQEVGDSCLIFSGLFPAMATKRLVKVSYYVGVGQAAYDTLSKKHNDIYHLLAKQFVPLMDVLQSIRNYSDRIPELLPLQAYDLWNETGSKSALAQLNSYTRGGAVIKTDKKDT